MAESYNLCLDIGGTKVLGVVFNSKKEIVYRLKKKTKYYVKVRAIRYSGGTKYVGKWSKVKSIKTK